MASYFLGPSIVGYIVVDTNRQIEIDKLGVVLHCEDQVRVILGRWGKFFGCWVEKEGRLAHEMVFHFPDFLEIYGIANLSKLGSATRPRHHLPEDEYAWPEDYSAINPYDESGTSTAADLLQNYFQEIPWRYRYLASRLGLFQWAVLDAIWLNESFADFLETELRHFGSGYVSLALDLISVTFRTRADRKGLIRQLMCENRRTFISQIFGRDIPQEFIRILTKFGGEPVSRDELSVLLDLHASRAKWKVVRHAQALSKEDLEILEELPDWACTAKVLAIFPHIEDVARLNSVLRKFEAIGGDSDLDAIIRSFQNTVVDRMSLLKWLRRKTAAFNEKYPFSRPPFRGNSKLRPLLNAASMIAESRRMKNCLGSRTNYVRVGRRFYYVWDAVPRANIEVMKKEDGSWVVSEVAGAENSKLSESVLAEINREISKQLSAGS